MVKIALFSIVFMNSIVSTFQQPKQNNIYANFSKRFIYPRFVSINTCYFKYVKIQYFAKSNKNRTSYHLPMQTRQHWPLTLTGFEQVSTGQDCALQFNLPLSHWQDLHRPLSHHSPCWYTRPLIVQVSNGSSPENKTMISKIKSPMNAWPQLATRTKHAIKMMFVSVVIRWLRFKGWWQFKTKIPLSIP